MRALLIALMAVVSLPAAAIADDEKPAKKTPKKDKDKADTPPPPPRTPGPQDAKAVAILDKLVAATDQKARDAVIVELTTISTEAPGVIDAIGEWIARPHPTDVADRRKVLAAIKAAVPDKNGRWPTPPRQSGKELIADDQLDWVKLLTELDGTLPGTNEVIADVMAIRAIAATKTLRAAQVIFDVAFADESMIYRDECGRNLRKLEPHSIPALTRESIKGKGDVRRRYAKWQLERLDREDATKALNAATGNVDLQVAILDTFREVKHREAVGAVWAYANHDVPRVRAAARAAWNAYITGPPPPPAPRKKLQLPGGKLTKFPKPLWLTYRELADNELRKTANALLNEEYVIDEQRLDDYQKEVKAQKIDLEDVTKRVYEHYDTERAKRDTAQWLAAKAKADAGDLAGAAGMLDQLIAMNPERREKGEMAAVYVAYGKQLEGAQKWGEASAMFSKAHGLAPEKRTLAAVHFTLGKSLETAGKDGGPDFRKAVALDPEYAPAKSAAETSSSGDSAKPTWMLYAAIGAGAIAMLLFGVAMMRRRRHA